MADTGNMTARKQKMLAAAEKVFEASGYAATTMEAVAAKAGVSKGNLYNYFESKQDLFGQLCADLLARDEADLDRLVAEQGTAVEKLHQYLDNWVARLEDYIRIGRLMLEFWAVAARENRKGCLTTLFRGLYSRFRDRVAEILRQGLKTGEIAGHIDPRVAASLIMAVVDGVTVQAILDIGIKVDEAFLTALKRGILAGLTTEENGENQS